MGRIYDAEGKKMNVAEICEELFTIASDNQILELDHAIDENAPRCNGDSRKTFAHAVLDSYKCIDSTTEQGQRVRKLMDNLMNKYQKSSVQPTEAEKDAYQGLINKIRSKANDIRSAE